jgi:hypothetical protein
MVSRQDHIMRADSGSRGDPPADVQPAQPRSRSAGLVQPQPGTSRSLDHSDVGTDSLRRTGVEISDLHGSVLLNPVDPSILSEEVVGHAGLARALQDFVTYWHDELGGYAAHLDSTGQQLGQTEARYRATDEDAAETLSTVDSDQSASGGRNRTW